MKNTILILLSSTFFFFSFLQPILVEEGIIEKRKRAKIEQNSIYQLNAKKLAKK